MHKNSLIGRFRPISEFVSHFLVKKKSNFSHLSEIFLQSGAGQSNHQKPVKKHGFDAFSASNSCFFMVFCEIFFDRIQDVIKSLNLHQFWSQTEQNCESYSTKCVAATCSHLATILQPLCSHSRKKDLLPSHLVGVLVPIRIILD